MLPNAAKENDSAITHLLRPRPRPMLIAQPATATTPHHRIRWLLPRRAPGLGWLDRRKRVVMALVVLALAPVIYVLARTTDARSGIVYWDEFDTALALMVKLKEGTTPRDFLHDLFALNNEHRMVTSRLLFAGSYWLTGTIDFALIDVIGKGTIVAMCLLLVASAGTGPRRLRLGLLLAFLLFQLEHYENFLWSGSSIDHFQVVLLAAAALFAVSRGTLAGTLAGGVFATLATFTLTHGIAVWPVGAALLGLNRRWRDLAIWGGLGALAVGGFFIGFKVNGAESFVSFSAEGALKIIRYWLAILGAAPALGAAKLAPYLGGALLALVVWVMARGALRRERIALPLALFALAAAGLIAIGRAEHSGGEVFSRYYVLSAVAWSLGLFMLIERHTHPRRPLRPLVALLPALIAFNVFANREFSDKTDSWLTCRDIAAVNYKEHGADGQGPFNLHPIPNRSTLLLQRAEALGVYRIGPVCLPVPFPKRAKETDQIKYFIEDVSTNTVAAAVHGWAAIPGRNPGRGSIHLVLRSPNAVHLFTAVTVPRPDVSAAMKQPGWMNAGFHFARRLDRLPTGDYQIGLLIVDGRRADYVMTEQRLTLGSPGLIAAAQ